MTLNLMMTSQQEELKPRITVFGVGGAGGNAVNNMIDKHLEGVEFVVANTDAQALKHSKAHARIQMGLKVTEGLGAGARPQVGAAAAEETIEEIVDHLAGAHMCFITAGMGGGTGTGAAPIIAQAARELGVLTVGVVTKPFQFEGAKRMKQAEEGIEALQKVVDTLIIIPNQNLFRLANERTTFTEAFAMADDVLYQGVKGVTDLMVRPGLINLDFADVRAVMDEMGKAMMGTGEATGEDRAVQAAEKAIANPLLDEISLNGARGVLINITGGYDLTLFELDEAANIIREKVDPDANIIVGSTLDENMGGAIRVSVVATGIDVSKAAKQEAPVARRSMAAPLPQPTPAPEPRREVPLTVQQMAPAAQHAAPQPEPLVMQQPVPQQQAPSLFDAQPGYEVEPEMDAMDDLPPPAYRPQPAPQQRPTAAMDQDAAAFMAPRPRAPGTPSPEALARLQAAVTKAPAAPAAQRPMAAQPRVQAPAPKPAEAPRPRFGIGSLINRMAGGGAEPQGNAMRQQPQVQGYDDEPEMNADQEKIEIPAFLRRQAN
ncbi:cell division protein FtsZ [Rhodobacteraceae bacterium HSP-20]|uniref:Cell division protein FtsZ n=1 Tax=Paragemmobacter amnigenus TaxID=2852097 RepID=A0ABS6IZQ1_9RHOB|nr:cell division protein FtsZ [Rhodobacter amnigenus]MBU9696828.1 cell division protein FtsZ [Rhodobacter amnigenus]MBV4388055.1 cell division protein FtsZ [Rhodobacter amnigenus]